MKPIPPGASPRETLADSRSTGRVPTAADPDAFCPACGAVLVHEKCKVVCRSEACTYRIVFSCSEF